MKRTAATVGLAVSGLLLADDAVAQNRDRAKVEYATAIFYGNRAGRSADLVVSADGAAYVAVTHLTSEVIGTSPSGAPDFVLVDRVHLTKVSPAGDTIEFDVSPGRGRRPSVAVDRDGAAYVAGIIVTDKFQSTPGALDEGGPGFVAKYDANGRKIFAARLPVLPLAVAVDVEQRIYLTGQAAEGFHATPRAFQTTATPGGCSQDPFRPTACSEAFVGRLSPDGSRWEWATFLGGRHDEIVHAIAVDESGAAVVAGETGSADFPDEDPQRFGGAIETADGKLGDLFVAKLDPDGAALVYSSLLGGENRDAPADVALLADGSAVVVGTTDSSDFPGAGDAGPGGFFVRFAADGSVAASAVLADIRPTGVSELPGGDLAVGAFGDGPCGARGRILRLSPDGAVLAGFAALRWDYGFDADADGAVYSVGGPQATPLLVTEGAARRYGGKLVSKLSLTPSSQPALVAVRNAAGGLGRSGDPWLSPGEIVSLYGAGLGPAEAVSMDQDGAPPSLGGTVVSLGGRPIPLLYAGDCQVNAVVPFGIELGQTTLQLETPAGSTPASRVEILETLPGLFQLEPPRVVDRNGVAILVPGRVAALNEDGTLNSSDNPAARGSIVSLFLTGLNSLEPVPPDGSIVGLTPPFPSVTGKFEAFIEASAPSGAAGMEILYAGAVPGAVAGLIQMNVRIPELALSGDRVRVRIVTGSPYGNTQPDVGIAVE